MDTPKDCPKCSGAMHPGFIVDKSYGANHAEASTWQEGEPVWSFWTGVQLRTGVQHAVTSWRCEQCGYLESYAE